MKQLTLILTILLFACYSNAQIKPTPKVDERTELLSIVFKLANAQEYKYTHIQSYAEDIVTYFEPYREHELISWIPELREQYGIGYDAVMSYAIHLRIENGKVSFLDNISIGDIDVRWKQEVAEEFLVKLNEFYTESKFNEFYNKHKALYAIAEKNFTTVLDLVKFDWFKQYYGVEPNGSFRLIVSITNGMGNYGPQVNYVTGEQDVYAIMGTWDTDSIGNPIYSEDDYLDLIIHEFSHTFCNPLADELYLEIKDKADELYNLNSALFTRQAYGKPSIVMRELLVRAAVIQYYKKTEASQEHINSMIKEEQQLGFLWIDKLCDKLDEYETQQAKYPTLHSFMSEIAKMLNGLSLAQVVEEYEAKFVKIASISIPDGSTAVDPNTKSIVVTFDKAMNTKGVNISIGKKGKDYLPKNIGTKWNEENKKELVISVELEPDTEYSISFPAKNRLIGENGEPLLKTYYLDFKTRK